MTMDCFKCKKAILMRVQERFNEWADSGIETGSDLNIAEYLIDAKVNLDHIIKEESENEQCFTR